VELAEEMHQKKQLEEKKSLETAMNLIEKEDFEEAIQRLDELKNNPEITSETEKLRDLAVDKLINRERDKAAKIYLMAKKSKDPKQKKELLMASQKILKTLIKEYPQSNLIDKLKSNLESVNKDLKEFQNIENDNAFD
jgi:outer membrane protein assembly factor BamD (BamD/ComL family)